METMIKVRNLVKTFHGESVLNHLDLDVDGGEICGIAGRNGSGKSVLFKIIAGIMVPDSGQVTVCGEEIRNGKFPSGLGMILDHTGFLPSYSAFENLRMIAAIQRKVSDEEIKETIRLVGLDPNSKKCVRKFSAGMKQRLAFAQAIMEKPGILLLDEPMTGLDKSGCDLIRNLILDVNRKFGTTVLMTSHISGDMKKLCRKVYFLEDGRIKNRIL